jgi:hypothetical protein
MKRVIVRNLDGQAIMSVDCDEYRYGDPEDYHDVEGREMFLYKNDIIQAVIPYRKFIIQFIYEV